MIRPALVLGAFVLLAISLPLVPTASAHAEAFGDSKVLTLGKYGVYIEPNPDPMYAGIPTRVRALISDTASGSADTKTNLTIDVSSATTSPSRVDLSQVNDDFNYRSAPIFLPKPGNYTLLVTLRDGDHAFNTTSWFDVFPNLPFRIQPNPANPDPYVGAHYTFEVFVVNTTTLKHEDRVSDMSMRLERWTDDHKTLLSHAEYSLVHNGTGMWVLERDITDAGMYHLRFGSRSGNFSFGDTPLFHVYATVPVSKSAKPAVTGGGGGSSPDLHVAAVLVTALFVALRRRTV